MTRPPRDTPRRLGNRIADLATRRPRAVLAVAAVLVALAGWRIAKLRLETDFAQLLPQGDPAVVALLDGRTT